MQNFWSFYDVEKSKYEELHSYINDNINDSADAGFIIEHISQNYKDLFQDKYWRFYNQEPYYNGVCDCVHLDLLFTVNNEKKEYVFYIPLHSTYINYFIDADFDKCFIINLIKYYLTSQIKNDSITMINWDALVKKLEYNDFTSMVNSCMNENDKYFILSKVKDSNLVFFSKMWLLLSHGYLSEIFSLIYSSIFAYKTEQDINTPIPLDSINKKEELANSNSKVTEKNLDTDTTLDLGSKTNS